MKDLLARFKNFYLLSGVIFLLWVGLFDTNNLLSQAKLTVKQRQLESTKSFYEAKILEVNNSQQTLTADNEVLEKIAREKYFMKKAGEEVFVIVEE